MNDKIKEELKKWQQSKIPNERTRRKNSSNSLVDNIFLLYLQVRRLFITEEN